MNSNGKLWLAMIVVAIIAVGAYYYPTVKSASQSLFGSTACSSITCLSGGLRLVSDAGGDFESDVAALFAAGVGVTGTTTDTGNIVVTTSNTATSSIQVGCVQTTATSTATPIRMAFTLGFAGSTTFSGTSAGTVQWEYGKCPRV